MAIDIQVLSTTLLDVMQTQLQQAFDSTCFPPFEPNYIDHVEVRAGTVTLTPDGAAQFTLPVDIFVVDMPSLLAAANGTPTGATAPRGSANIVLSLTISETTLTLMCTDVKFDAKMTALLGPAAGFVALGIKTQIGTVGTVDLNSIFSSLGLPMPATSVIVQAGTSLFLRFDPSGSPVDTLQTGQDWCLFVDAATMQNVSAAQVNQTLSSVSLITSHTTTAVWAPSGTVPHVNVTLTGKVTVPDPFSGDFEMDLGIDFGIGGEVISSVIVSYLLELITWTWKPSAGLGSVDTKELTKVQNNFNTTGFGGTIISPNEFSLEQTLPSLALGSAVFKYGAPVGLSTGMVLGGAVTGIVAPDTSLVSFSVSKYSDKFTLFDFCQGGSPPPTLSTVVAMASASYTHAVKLCSVTVLSPSPSPVDLTHYLVVSPGPGAEAGSITLDFNGLVSQTLAATGQPVELLVQTTRGVRVINLGVPPTPKIGPWGNLTNYTLIRVNNCPTAVDPWYQMFQNFNPLWNVDPPESWVENIDQVAAFETLLISVNGVQPGELVTFNQPIDGGLTVVSADLNGQAILPAILAVRRTGERAILSRANRGALGNTAVSGVIFQRVATLHTPGAISHELVGNADDATITTRFPDGRIQSVLVCGFGVSRPFGTQAALRTHTTLAKHRAEIRSSTSATPPPAAARPIDIPGLVKVLSIPGLEKSPLAVAKLSDGTHLALSRQSNGEFRVVGIVRRWPDMPPVSGRSGDQLEYGRPGWCFHNSAIPAADVFL